MKCLDYIATMIRLKMLGFNDYAKIKINEIKLRQTECDNLNAMVSKYRDSMNDKYEQILLENGIPYDFVVQKTISHCQYNEKSNPKETETEKSNPKESLEPVIIDENKNICNSLFKSLALATHPDKSNADKNDFLLVRTAYESNDVFTLLEFAVKYDVPKDDICDELMLLILEKKTNEITKKIDNIKGMIVYHLLIYGHIDKHITDLKYLMKIEQENKEYAENLKNK